MKEHEPRIVNDVSSFVYFMNALKDYEEVPNQNNKVLEIGSRLSQLKIERERIKNLKSAKKSPSIKSPKNVQNSNNKKGIYSDIDFVLKRINKKRIDNNDNIIKKRDLEYNSLFSYENFLFIKKFDRFKQGEKIVELKKEKMKNLLKVYDKIRASSRDIFNHINKSKFSKTETDPFEVNEKLILPQIKSGIRSNSNNNLKYKPLFSTEIKNIPESMEDLNTSIIKDRNEIITNKQKNYLCNSSNLNKGIKLNKKQTLKYLPPVLKTKMIDHNLLPSVNKKINKLNRVEKEKFKK